MNVSVSERRSGIARWRTRWLVRFAVAGLGGACGVVLIPEEAAAQTSEQSVPTNPDPSQRARARELGDRGLRAFDAGDYSGATELFRQALELYDFPTLRLYLARSLVRQGSPVAATREYESLLARPVRPDEGDFGADARASARRELPGAEARQVRLTLTIRGASPDGLRLEVSGRSTPLVTFGRECQVEPGKYDIRVTHPDGRAITRSIVLAEGETQRLELDWSEASAPPPGAAAANWDTADASYLEDDPPTAQASEAPRAADASYAPAWVAGVLTAGLAGGAILTGLLATERKDDYDDRNRRPDIDAASKRDLRDKALQMQVLNAAFSAAALIGGSVTVYFILREPPASTARNPSGQDGLSSVASGWVVGVHGDF